MPPAVVYHARAILCDEEEVMEQELLEGEREGCEYTEEADSLVSILQNSTDSDRQTEEEDEAEMSDEPTGEPAEGPTDETTVKFVEGHPPDDELTEGHPPNDELTEDYPPDDQLVERITVNAPLPGRNCCLEVPGRRTG